MAFIPLHTNSIYTLLSSALTIEKITKICKDKNLKAFALTDNNSFTGSVKFFQSLKDSNTKSIIGLDIIFEDNLFTLLIQNETGWKNALYISKLYNQNILSLDEIKSHNEGLIAIISSNESNLIKKFNETNEIKFAYYLKKYFDAFSSFHIGLEIYDDNDKNNIKKLKAFLLKRDYSLIAFPFIKYINKEDEFIVSLANGIKEELVFDESFTSKEGKYYFRNDDELNNLYEIEEINKTEEISNSINFDLIKKRGTLLNFSSTPDEDLKNLSYQFLTKKIEINDVYKQRLDYELSVIKKMGYSNYFLIVADYVKFAKDNNIYVGPGRGSAGGSLVAYALDIVTIDPIKCNLLFERFLNEGRKTMPDIDVDFEDVRREEVFEYIKEKYGKERMGKVLTLQTIKAKQAIRDIGRLYKIKDSYIDILCKSLGDIEDLHEGYKQSSMFKNIVDSDKYYLFIVKLASKIEGLPRQSSLHAAGVIIDNNELYKNVPIYIDRDGNITSQYEKDDLETLGFLKMDILGIKNLYVVKKVIEEANKDNKVLDYNSLPYDDLDAIKLIAKGKTLGLFQLESKGMIRTIKSFKPKTFEDVVVLISLFRPGPMQFIPQYVARKEGRQKIVYPCKQIESILKSTYGIIVYQEQIMEIVRVMANFSYSEADSFRRAISKKDAKKMIAIKESFIDGCIKNGNNKKESEDVFNLIYKFANYGFNRSHAFGYAKLGCQMAYLKLHYPLIFYASILDYGDHFDDVMAEIKDSGIKFILPNINFATLNYSVNENSLVVPFNAIKGIQNNNIQSIIKEREKNGPYKDFIDFVLRNNKNNIAHSTYIKLIEVGAFDSFNISRASLKEGLTRVLNYAKLMSGNQMSLDDNLLPPPNLKIIKDNEIENVEKEIELLGFSLSKSLLDFYQEEIKKEGALIISKINPKAYNCKIVGIIKSIRRIKTRKDKKEMCFITLSDDIKDVTLVIFNKIYEKYQEELYSAKIIFADVRHDFTRDEFIANDIKIFL